MFAKGRSLLRSKMSRASLVNPPTHAGDRALQRLVGFTAVHNTLHIRVDIAWKTIIQESTSVSVFHNQILLCFADRAAFV